MTVTWLLTHMYTARTVLIASSDWRHIRLPCLSNPVPLVLKSFSSNCQWDRQTVDFNKSKNRLCNNDYPSPLFCFGCVLFLPSLSLGWIRSPLGLWYVDGFVRSHDGHQLNPARRSVSSDVFQRLVIGRLDYGNDMLAGLLAGWSY